MCTTTFKPDTMPQTLQHTHTGKTEAILAALLLCSITVFIPLYDKTWFVDATGNMSISPTVGAIVSFLLVRGYAWGRTGAQILAVLVLAVSAWLLLSSSGRPGFLLLMALASALLVVLRTTNLKTYCQKTT
jgi:hypothetical protein